MKQFISVLVFLFLSIQFLAACQQEQKTQTASLPLPSVANDIKAKKDEKTATTNKQAAQTQSPSRTSSADSKSLNVKTASQSNDKSIMRHVVVKGESLWQIAARPDVYGDPLKWPLIYAANRDKIKDPDLVIAKSVLKIQRNATPDQIALAVKHAKTRGNWKLKNIETADASYLAKTTI